LIGTVLSYVEAGTGFGVVTEGILTAGSPLRFVPLSPKVTVPLVLVWQEDGDTPPLTRFRELLAEWLKAGLLWD
jgi:DNA-binding transcriptional LysR family regulator